MAVQENEVAIEISKSCKKIDLKIFNIIIVPRSAVGKANRDRDRDVAVAVVTATASHKKIKKLEETKTFNSPLYFFLIAFFEIFRLLKSVV